MSRRFSLDVLPGRLAVCRLAPSEPVPAWAWQGALSAVTRTAQELSVVCQEAAVPEGVPTERGWRALRVEGPLSFEQVGVLATLLAPLAEAGVSVFALSTYDTDYVLVREPDLTRAVAALRSAGHTVREVSGRPGHPSDALDPQKP